MENLPERLNDEKLLQGLGEFGIRAATIAYLPVGFGDYHWNVTGADGQRWFATVSDLEHKEHCGDNAASALKGLRRAMGTAACLHEDGLDFVVAPVRTTGGELLVELDERYALSIFPLLAGESGEFGQVLATTERDQVLDMLARLHTRTAPASTPRTVLDPSGRRSLETALDELSGSWDGGPFAEPARELVAEHAELIRTRLADFDRLADNVRQRDAALVVTHGEPHPGNLLRTDDGYLLVDWDTVGLALPERDLSVVSDDPAAFARYAEVTGKDVDAAALALYRLRWSLVDLAEFVVWFRGPHTRTPDSEAAWKGFTETVEQLADPSPRG
ncbi:phosphotransferase [Saccharopolyspora erythraea]|uniref:phosphotransferase n=1 Tax=Saccharopolyspora erythraea TaxID=1836 RepID=UPI001BEEF5CC|nr:phosphotransferase [Saccharopolyspora erythraea]QUH01888.1 phosphotransferase [Saccharopolyspora erythraea]